MSHRILTDRQRATSVASLLPMFRPDSTRRLPRLRIEPHTEVFDHVIHQVVHHFKTDYMTELREYMHSLSPVLNRENIPFTETKVLVVDGEDSDAESEASEEDSDAESEASEFDVDAMFYNSDEDEDA